MRLKRIAAAILAVALISGGAFAAEAKGLSYWMKSTGSKIQGIQKKQKKDTATAGVKGAAEKASDDLYWKEAGAIKEEEVKALDAAIALINDGKNNEAFAALEKFISDYPKSQLKADAQEGLKLLKAEKKP
ncbi:MAG: hypothetical protein HY884_01675 [Deltaproteobacteria bacterium]|nr:hypothetical protein [Deltaproteobacteria bacterium]